MDRPEGLLRAQSRNLLGTNNRPAFVHRLAVSLSLVVLCAGIVLRDTGGAIAQPTARDSRSWERLPDGRVLIAIKSVRVAMPADDRDVDNIIIWERSFHRGFSLRQVIDDPDQARQFFDQEPLIYIHIPNIAANRFNPARSDGLFLGHFDPAAYESFGFSILIGETAQNDCRSLMDEARMYRERLTKESTPTDRNGWAEFVTGRNPGRWIYIKRETPSSVPSNFDSITCTELGDCSASLCLEHDHSFSYQFVRTRFRNNTWPNVVQRAADVLNYVLPYENVWGAGR
jgi:hypothetical protein